MWKKRLLFALLVIFLVGVVLPFGYAFTRNASAGYFLGTIENHSLHALVVDGSITDRYRCLIYDRSFPGTVALVGGQILVDQEPVDFPHDRNVAWLAHSGKFVFDSVSPHDVVGGRDDGLMWVFGTIPRFKHFPKCGRPSDEYIRDRVERIFANENPVGAIQWHGEAMGEYFDEPRILGMWRSENINGDEDDPHPMWMVHQYTPDGKANIRVAWIEDGQVQTYSEDDLDFTYFRGRLSLGQRNEAGVLETDSMHLWNEPVEISERVLQYDGGEGDVVSWTKLDALDDILRDVKRL